MSATTLRTRPEIGNAAAPVFTAAVRLPAFGPTGPDVLAVAAHILPGVSSRLPLAGDVHLALVEALVRLRAGVDWHHRLRLADDARDMFAAFLVAAGLTRPEEGPSATVRGWVVFQDLATVRLALAGAAWFWDIELAAALSTPEGSSLGMPLTVHNSVRPGPGTRRTLRRRRQNGLLSPCGGRRGGRVATGLSADSCGVLTVLVGSEK